MKIKDDIYVDNLVFGMGCEEDAIKLYSELKQVFKNASMNLKEWISNSQKVNDNLRSEDKLKDKTLKVLDIVWNTVIEDIQISTKQINRMQPTTANRKVIVGTVKIRSSFLLTPSTIVMKILFHDIFLGKR